jgi:protocatechuate 3,4-dioxygenase beta subunit
MTTRFALAAVSVFLAAQQAGVTVQQPGAEQPEAAAQQPTKPEDKCSVEGHVSNAITGDPLKKAHITLNRMDGGTRGPRNASYGAATDAGGHFLIQDIEPGTYQMSATRNGFVALSYGATRPDGPSTPLSLNPGRRMRDIVFRLTPDGVIVGHVLDEDGEPMQGASISAMRFRSMRGKRQLMPFMSSSTDDLGEYRLFGLVPGKYYLSATYRQQRMMMPAQDSTPGGTPDEDYAPTYFPGTSDPTGAAPIDVAAGTVLSGIDVTLRKTRTVRVRGRVVNTMGEGLPGRIMLRLMPRNMMYAGFMSQRMTQATRSNGGAFEFRGVTPGAYVLMAHWNDEAKNFSVRQPVDVGNENVNDVNVALTPGFAIKGQVRVDGTGEVAFGSLQIALESQMLMMMGRANAGVKNDGSFEMENVAADNYRVNVYGLPAPFYVKSIRIGDADGLEAGVDLSRGAGGPLEIMLSPNGGQVEGTVVDAKQQPATATVVLVPDLRHRDQTQLFKMMGTNASGHFTIAGIAPGDYKLFAWQHVEGDGPQDPEFLKPYENQGQSLTIREGGRESMQLKLIPTDAAPKSASN